jgi:hypothetical protein
MSSVGYYRYKTTANQEKTLSVFINGSLAGSKDIVPVDSCEDDLIIKYLDKNGHYRFRPFNKYYQKNDDPTEIGKVNRFITNIRTDQSDTQSVGYRNNRLIFANTDIPNNELEKFIDIYTSPRVYLYIGDGTTDNMADWVEVKLTSRNNIVKRSRGNTGRIDITIELPANYSVQMI